MNSSRAPHSPPGTLLSFTKNSSRVPLLHQDPPQSRSHKRNHSPQVRSLPFVGPKCEPGPSPPSPNPKSVSRPCRLSPNQINAVAPKTWIRSSFPRARHSQLQREGLLKSPNPLRSPLMETLTTGRRLGPWGSPKTTKRSQTNKCRNQSRRPASLSAQGCPEGWQHRPTPPARGQEPGLHGPEGAGVESWMWPQWSPEKGSSPVSRIYVCLSHCAQGWATWTETPSRVPFPSKQ